ncbi:phage tail tape measure protein [Lactococcus taiwanensis]|uniref:phage tail tape measure protein n=1 Tax=Lactococcus taiwanensis TaxID=1151742 RepID=UPI003515785A
MEDAADVVASLNSQLGDMPSGDMARISRYATILRDQFDMDLNESLRGINSLMTNFGLSADEAFDYMMKGAQRGLDKTDELGDNLAEYGQIWSQAGFDVKNMFGILENGLKSGAYNLDKVNDFVKEFTISLNDGRIQENLNHFSEDTKKIFDQFQKGKATASDVFKSVISDLKNTENQQEKLSVASTVWSAVGEDNAMKVIESLGEVNDAYKEVSGTAQKTAEETEKSFGLRLKNNIRKVEASLIPVGNKILDITEKYMPSFGEVSGKVFGGLWVSVDKVCSYLDSHKKNIVDIIDNSKVILGIVTDTAWNIFKDTLNLISEFLGNTSENGKKAKDPLQQMDDILTNLAKHKVEIERVTKIVLAMWATKKIFGFINAVKEAKKALIELKAVELIVGDSGLLNFKGVKTVKGTKVAKEAGDLLEGAETAKSFSKLGKVGEVAKSGLKTAGRGIAGLDILLSLSELIGINKNNAGQKIGAATGSLGGTAAGGMAGAAIGSVVPGIGTVVGGAIGAGLGALGGTELGKNIGEWITKGRKEENLKSEKLPVIKFDVKTPTQEMKQFSKEYQAFIDQINKTSNVNLVNEKGLENAKRKTSAAYTQMKKDIDKFYSALEKDSKKQVDILVKNGVITQEQANKLNKSQKVQDDKQKKNQKVTLDRMKKLSSDYYNNVAKENKKANEVRTRLTKEHEAQIKKIKSGNTNTLLAIEKQYGKKSPQYQKQMTLELLRANNAYYAQSKAEKKAHNKKMNELEKEYVKAQNKAEKSLNSQISTATKIAQNKQMDLLEDLRKKKGKLNLQQLKETVQTADNEYKAVKDKAQKQKDAAIKSANEKYKKTVEAANKERAENSSMSREQYEEIVKNAKKQRSETVNHAKGQYKEVVDKATKTHDSTIKLAEDKADKTVKAVASERGETVKEYIAGARSTRDVFNSIIDGVNGVLNFLHKGWGKIGYFDLKGFATGTRGLPQDEIALVGEEGFELAHHPSRGIFALGVNGPEIRNLQAGTSILPHAMSKEFLAMTANLPAHANGVKGVMTEAADWLKSTYKDVSGVLSKGPSAVIDGIYKKLGLDSLTENFSPVLSKLAKGSFEISKDKFVNYIKSFFKKAEKDAGGSLGAPSGVGVQRWAGQVKKALAANGLSTSQDMIDRVLRQIQTESGGNEKAVQGDIGDINNITGDLAKGLMQTISATFNAYKFPGHGDIFNGYDNLLAALNYAKHRYGPSLSFLGNGHGYANGGWADKPSIFGEISGEPEVVINPKRNSADQLILEAIEARANKAPDSLTAKISKILTSAKNDIQNVLPENNNISTSRSMIASSNTINSFKNTTNDTSDKAVSLLSEMVAATKEQTVALKNQPAPIVDGHSFFKDGAAMIHQTQLAYQNSANRRRGIMNN